MKKELVNIDSDKSSESDDFDNKQLNKDVATAYNDQLEDAMDKLVKSDYLDIDRLKNVCSPKFAQMYEDINTSPGSVLVYSQFRMIEGIGIFKEVLNRQGYAEINIIKINIDTGVI
jgi:hypothetical protein